MKVKLHATTSTNDYLKELAKTKRLPDSTIVVADKQTAGRGQRGKTWLSDHDSALTFSILKRYSADRHDTVNISKSIAVATARTLRDLTGANLTIKWPNDILSDDHKIAGILIENVFRKSALDYGVIGIGVNVNQTRFPAGLKATSLKKISGRDHHPDLVMDKMIGELEQCLEMPVEEMDDIYHTLLYRKGENCTFNADGETFQALIKYVDRDGRLTLLRGKETQKYLAGEIKMLR